MAKAITFQEIAELQHELFSYIDGLWEAESTMAADKFTLRRAAAATNVATAAVSLNLFAFLTARDMQAKLEAKIASLTTQAERAYAEIKKQEGLTAGAIDELGKGASTVAKFAELAQKWSSISESVRRLHAEVQSRGSKASWTATNGSDVDYEKSVQTQLAALDELAGITKHNSESSEDVSTLQASIYSLAKASLISAKGTVSSVEPNSNQVENSFFGATLNAESVVIDFNDWLGENAEKLTKKAQEPAEDVENNLQDSLASGKNINREWPKLNDQHAAKTEVGETKQTVSSVENKAFKGRGTTRVLRLS